MLVLTGAEMREADRQTIEVVGIPGRVLMESAGRAAVRMMERALRDLRARSIAIVCGKGNNGGDGLVVFRYLASQGYRARAWVLSPFEDLAGDARDNLEAALKLGAPVSSVPDEKSWGQAVTEIGAAGVVVDAIFGTGLTSAPRGLPERAIRDINRLSAFKVAVDIPSGLSSDSGEVFGEAIRADLTVALAAPKLCHLLPPACFRVGQLEVVDIGIPDGVIRKTGSRLETLEAAFLRGLLPSRPPDSHKGDFGHLLILAGSVGKTGAAILASRAALRAGAGLVTVASSRSSLPLIAPAVAEVMVEPLPETSDGSVALGAWTRLMELLDGKSALAIGPGLGRHPETVSLVKKVVGEARLPLALDADGLNAFEGDLTSIPRGRPLALTPHPGEMGRLIGASSADVQSNRLAAVRRVATEGEVHVLLKGYRSLIAEPSGHVYINLTGNPGMASGGTGDVLTGMIGSFLAQGLSPKDSLCLGTYLHGLAGDLAAAEIGQTALTATDLTGKLPEALRKLGAP